MSRQQDWWYAGELQEAPPGPRFDPSVPDVARIYAYWLGGKDNFPADRVAAEEVIQVRPQVVAAARANRQFLARVVRFMAGKAGISQFLDIGTGLPAPNNTHEIAQKASPHCKVVYCDNDPLVLVHARALLTATPGGECAYVDADVRDTGTIVEQAAKTLDFKEPVGLLLLAVMHFIPDADDPAAIVAALVEVLPPGSLVAISHLTGDFAPAEIQAAVKAYNDRTPTSVTARSREDLAALFGDLPLIPPGLVAVNHWRPGVPHVTPPPADMYAAVAERTPGRM